MDDYDIGFDMIRDDPDPVDFTCSACKGKGTVNPLTAPDDLPPVFGTTTCPRCDGTGHETF